MEKKTIFSDRLGPNGGKMISPDGRFSVEVPANVLTKDYNFTLKISPQTKNSETVTSLEFSESISDTEKNAFIVKNLDEEQFAFHKSSASSVQQLFYFQK